MDIFQKILELLKFFLYCLGFLVAKAIILLQSLSYKYLICIMFFTFFLILSFYIYKLKVNKLKVKRNNNTKKKSD